MSRDLERQAQFLLRVASESSTDRLRALLRRHPDQDFPILQRLNELHEGENLNVLIRHAFRYWTEGMDDDALEALKQAQSIAPDEKRVLQLELFFEVTFGSHDEARILAQHLLDLYPEDEWTATLKHRLEVEDRVTTIYSPPLGFDLD